MQEILLNIESKELRCAVLKNGKLQNLFVERKKTRQLTGNIYKGEATHILSNIQSAFINIGEGENGFIHISDIIENTRKLQEMFDLDFDFEPVQDAQPKDISEWLKEGQWVLVQVVKEPIGSKGARLTCNISLPGRYLVLLPNSPHRGVSRKIEDRSIREKLRRLIKGFELPNNMGIICRTACKFAQPEQIQQEAQELIDQWYAIVEDFQKSPHPKVLHHETSLIKRSILTAVDQRYDRVLIDDYKAYQSCKQLYEKYADEHPLKIEMYRDKVPMFERFNVEREIDRSLKRKLWLSSGGYLFFDRTEAMTTIDVNSGRSNAGSSEGDLEESLVRINLEAAEEIARQLRIRNIGGLIICDFIDMRSKKNQRRLLDHLKECMRDDDAKCSILGMSEFGLVEMTRQRTRESLQQTLFCECPYCHGLGQIKNHETLSIEIERSLKKAIDTQQQYALELVTHPDLDRYLLTQDKEHLRTFAESLNARLSFTNDDSLHLNDFYFNNTLNQTRIEV
jgi:ribonuclease G